MKTDSNTSKKLPLKLLRLFISIPMPQAVSKLVRSLQQDMITQNIIKASFTPLSNIHITLVFLGSMPESDVDVIIDKLTSIQIARFTASLGVLEINSWKKPRTLWLTVASAELEQLAHTISLALSSMVPESDKHPFKGHITLARIRKILNIGALRNYITQTHVEPLTWTITEFTLEQSLISQVGSQYTTLHTFKLTHVR
jgi:RNA 2',3'-cyclic 3'-phosphodiesterase